MHCWSPGPRVPAGVDEADFRVSAIVGDDLGPVVRDGLSAAAVVAVVLVVADGRLVDRLAVVDNGSCSFDNSEEVKALRRAPSKHQGRILVFLISGMQSARALPTRRLAIADLSVIVRGAMGRPRRSRIRAD